MLVTHLGLTMPREIHHVFHLRLPKLTTVAGKKRQSMYLEVV
jgi:hypothetical protein